MSTPSTPDPDQLQPTQSPPPPLYNLLEHVELRTGIWRFGPSDLHKLEFTSIALHPVDVTALRKALAYPITSAERIDRCMDLVLIQDSKIQPGSAELRSPLGDRWSFHWDPRWRCGGCGRELPNDDQHDPRFMVPYCGDCSRVHRPGMYGVDDKDMDKKGESA